ncbi:MAG: hypothetical protein Q9160_005570 [Pyrenula sp. 1 TL-2023]
MDQEKLAAAKEKGWNQPMAHDYESYNASGKDAGEYEAGWGHATERYEWLEEYGDVAPRFPKLEEQLFHSDLTNRKGDKLDVLTAINVTAESTDRPAPIGDFANAGLHPTMVQNIQLCGYEVPTPVQAYTIPAVLQNRDVIGVAQTGSGKTAAFLIPTISKLMGKARKLCAPRPGLANGYNQAVDWVRAEPLILVVAPTRELCTQIFDEARRLEQRQELQKGCDILIATPGRLIDFMSDSKTLTLQRVRYTIIDEADEMLHMDWEDDLRKIMAGGGEFMYLSTSFASDDVEIDTNEDANHRYLMFSATFKKDMRRIAKDHLNNDYVRVRVGRAGSTHLNVHQRLVYCVADQKTNCLYDLILSMPPSRTLIFVNTKRAADHVDDFLYNHGLPSTSIHSDRTQREREDALYVFNLLTKDNPNISRRAFRAGTAPIMVTTGVSARGLDIKNVMHVINFDLPSGQHGGIDEYIHRIGKSWSFAFWSILTIVGRTGRIGNEGLATSFYNERNDDLANDIVKILLETGQEIPDFLDAFKPETGEAINFDDDTDNEGEGDGNGDAADTWG